MNHEPKRGLPGTWYPKYPVLGLASNGRHTFLAGGGGGASAHKEVPNMVQAYRYDEATQDLVLVGELSTEKSVVINLTYAKSLNYWLASTEAGCRVLDFDESTGVLKEVLEWQSEENGKEKLQNLAVCSPTGELIATGGTDGMVRLWKIAKPLIERPTLLHTCAKGSEVSALDFTPDGTRLVSIDDTGVCKIWDTATGTEKSVVEYQFLNTGKFLAFRARGARFIAGPEGSPTLVLTASPARGPGFLALFDVDGKKLKSIQADAKPVSGLAVDLSGRWAGVNLSTGGKKVYSLPGLGLSHQVKEVHELPAPCAALLGEIGTMVSGSGDRCIHVMQRGGGMRLCSASCAYTLFMLLMFLVAAYLFLRIGIKGASLDDVTGGEL